MTCCVGFTFRESRNTVEILYMLGLLLFMCLKSQDLGQFQRKAVDMNSVVASVVLYFGMNLKLCEHFAILNVACVLLT